jgi:hypothetical protein
MCHYFKRGRKNLIDGSGAPPSMVRITGLGQGDDHCDSDTENANQAGQNSKRADLSNERPIPSREKVIADTRVVVKRQGHVHRPTRILQNFININCTFLFLFPK